MNDSEISIRAYIIANNLNKFFVELVKYYKTEYIINVYEFTYQIIYEIPMQSNSDDCGVFICRYLDDLINDGNIFNFSSDDIPFYRIQLGVELICGRLLNS